MKEFAKLIADTLPQLKTEADPGRVLEAYPRQLNRVDEDAAPLVDALWNAIERSTVVPDGWGTLRQAQALWRHPREDAHIARLWQSLASEEQLSKMVHPSCLEKQRGSRLKVLADRLKPEGATAPSYPNLRQCDEKEWFVAVSSVEKEKVVQVLNLVEAFAADCKESEWSPIRLKVAIIPSDDDILLTPNQVVFAPEGTHVPGGRYPVARWLCEDKEAKRILTDVLKVKPLDDSVWIEVLRKMLSEIPNYPPDSKDKGWLEFWAHLSIAPPSVGQKFITDNRRLVRVKRRDGEWVLADQVLFPGDLVKGDDISSNQKLLMDTEVHGKNTELLVQLGVREFPEGIVPVRDFNGLDGWLNYWRKHYHQTVNDRASSSYLEPSELKLPAGWHFLSQLTGPPNAKLAAEFLRTVSSNQFPECVKFGHTTVASYRKIDILHPLIWIVLRYGTWNVHDTVVRLAAIVKRLHEPVLAKLPNWEEFQLALKRLKDVVPEVRVAPDEIRVMWQAIIKELVTPATLADDSLQDLWSGAARDEVVPASFPMPEGEIFLAQVFVSGSPDLSHRARIQGYVAVTLDAAALSLWLAHGARNLAEIMKPEWTEATGPEGLLVATIPELTEVLLPEVREKARCQSVAGLKLQVGGTASPVFCLMWENKLLLDTGRLVLLPRADRLRRLLAEAAAAGWLKCNIDEAMDFLGDAIVDELRANVAQGSSLAERLLRAVGNREGPLRQALGNVGALDFLNDIAAIKLSELVLAQLGPVALTTLKGTLEQEGLKPPSRWNTAEARTFVASIGFPEEFAASPQTRREAEEFISGPIELPPLHNFQQDVLDGIRILLASGTTRRRAVISLPTGAGKTRATVEASVLLVLKPEWSRRNVVWVAQTDELCEQAVQAFRQVWLNLGAQQTELRIVRLWGGNPNPEIQDSDKPAVVVASIQTLNSRMGSDGLAWLRRPGLVVVDECHHAITPIYTNLLRFLDADAPKLSASPKDEPPILGLSATPFRMDDEESGRLARRFDNLWLPANQEELYCRLRREGVLAEVNNEELNSGIDLTSEEIEHLAKFEESWEGIDFENLLEAINQRLAGSKERNERLVDRINNACERSILFFANSVLHSEEIAARLTLQGIPAAAISGNTPKTARRYFLSRFHSGKIRVLCNHTVLSTGFDTPKTDMVLISRAVFSPVRYMQMVGRGLRGEKNGGKACCRIVTVLDNLGRFRDRHPYHYCKRFFAP